MPRPSTFLSLPAVLFLLSSGLLDSLPLAAQQRNPQPPPPGINPTLTPPAVNYSVNGMVVDSASHARLDYVTVQLRSSNGAIVGTVVSNTNGTFHFDKVDPGTYTLIADQGGYQPATQQVEVFNSSVYGAEIELVKALDAEASVAPSTVSVRELSIPRNAHDDMLKGMDLLYAKSDYPGSIKQFEKAAQEFPGYYEAYAQIGVANMRLADTAGAEQAFRKSIEISREKYPDAYVGLAELFLSTHRSADAEPLARKAVDLDANSWQAHSELARTLVDLHRSAEAESSALAAVKLKPGNATLYLVLANVHIQLQNKPALLDDLNHYLQLAPDGPFAEQARRERDELQPPAPASQNSQPAPSLAKP